MSDKDKSALEKREETRPAELTRSERHYRPDVDIYETEQELVLLADMPGADRQSVDVDLANGVLTVSGRIRPRALDAGFTGLAREFQPGHFSRSFALGEELDAAKIEASMSRGVLRLRLPKAAAARARKIVVQQG